MQFFHYCRIDILPCPIQSILGIFRKLHKRLFFEFQEMQFIMQKHRLWMSYVVVQGIPL